MNGSNLRLVAQNNEMLVGAYSFDVRRGDVDRNLAQVEAGLREAASLGCQLVVLPEMWTTSFLDWGSGEIPDAAAASERALARVELLSRELDLVVAGTAPATSAAGLPFNRLTIFSRGARVLEYDKVHLFSPTAEELNFSAGAEAPAVVDSAATGLPPMSGAVCYDLRFAETLVPAVRAGAELLVIPAQWPITRASHWRALLQGRAVEYQSFIVASNRTGIELLGRSQRELVFPGNSMIVDPHGKILAEGTGESGLITAEIDFEVLRQLRIRVPISKDRRETLYKEWN
ncbi:MAG: omega-amidase [Planctomycetota bacterium]